MTTPPFRYYPQWTEARFWSFIRSALRTASMKWPPKMEAKKHFRRPYIGNNPRQKWVYQCQKCIAWFPEKETEMNHIVEVGELRDYDDLPGFVERLFCGVDGFECICKECHKKITHKT